MIVVSGNMWPAFGDGLFLVTTNSFVKNNGELVMGRGIAKQARDRFPGIALKCGQRITRECGHLGDYGLIVNSAKTFGLFQVKTHFALGAEPRLIRLSTDMLVKWCVDNPGILVNLNFPGIGNGGLSEEIVLPIIEALPDQVSVWKY